jgi:hypothetical protein
MKQIYAILACAALFALAIPALAQMGAPPIPMSPAEFAQSSAGANVQIAVRVKRVDRSTLYTELLAHESDTLAKATGISVTIYFPDGTPVIMGSASDVTAGALLYVYGVLTKPGHVDAKRVVVDTKYVTVH